MNPSLYTSAMEGNVAELRQHKDVLDGELTPNHNTVLHVAAQFGRVNYVEEVLKECPSLLHWRNTRGETPLHMAAREGRAEIVEALIVRAKELETQKLESGWGGAVKEMLRATNVDGDTALHMAARNCHLEEAKYLKAVKLLTKEDPVFQHPPNKVEETPLYLAAERGDKGVTVVLALLETCTSPTYSGPEGRTALHVAALKDSTGQCAKKLLDWKKDLINQTDMYGWTAVHYAACHGSEKGVKELLAVDNSGVYITSKTQWSIERPGGCTIYSNDDGLGTPLHIAAAHGHVSVIEELLSNNPDCWEMVNSKGQNVLHIAVDMNRDSVIKFILDKSWVRQLINQKDNDGNTPLHLLIASDCNVDELWKHQRADHDAFDGKNMTPVDLVWSNFEDARMSTFAATYVMDDTFLDSGISGGRNIAGNARDNLAKLERARTQEKEKRKMTRDAEKQRKKEERKTRAEAQLREHSQWSNSRSNRRQQALGSILIVASLIATITFAAAFAIPGGYDGNQGRDQGMAVLARAAAFKAFLVTNTIAMVCSVTSVFLGMTATLVYSNEEDEEENDDNFAKRLVAILCLILVSMFAIMVAFIAATFAVLAHSTALAVSICVISCTSFIVYYFELRKVWSLLAKHEASQARGL
ncbi:hypothetical protein RHGRI_012295 [Rhododendron griersonianum]|uniref:PGG domain-containing protein n=1 Tax=Rhododendron griersonianum TaxID=479676 RepID=A0AAV6KQ84_9ERIC|nr:hypothetical protein RHGRI_012295 [Rhododendron griersonianum]